MTTTMLSAHWACSPSSSLFCASLYRAKPHFQDPNLHPNKLRVAPLASCPSLIPRLRRLQPIRAFGGERDDSYYMLRCVDLARCAIGRTTPNPMVGCVIVNGGEVVGEGFHPKAGQPHAEVFALRNAGERAENATAYVSLEPCNHYGRTPPCTEALVKAKVRRVVIGMVDPNPIVAAKGVERLRKAGIEVEVGVEEVMCRRLNEAYIHRMITGKPFVTLRYSLSFNGKILNHVGEGAEESGGYYSKLLEEYDGIVTSSIALNKSSTHPTSKENGANQPLHIVIAREDVSLACLPSLASKSRTNTVVLAEKAINLDSESENIEIMAIPRLTFGSIVDFCGSRGLCSILVDFRGDDVALMELIKNSLEEHLLQKVVMEVCPVWDASGDSSSLNFGSESLKLKDLQSRISNGSVVVEGYIV